MQRRKKDRKKERKETLSERLSLIVVTFESDLEYVYKY
jgi:hypothetical protein